MQFVAFDAHKHYTLAVAEDADGHTVREQRMLTSPGRSG